MSFVQHGWGKNAHSVWDTINSKMTSGQNFYSNLFSFFLKLKWKDNSFGIVK